MIETERKNERERRERYLRKDGLVEIVISRCETKKFL